MIERAELCVHRNSTLKAGVMPVSSSGKGGSRRAMSPHSSGRPPQQVSVRKASNCRKPAIRAGMDDLAALAGRLRQPGALQRGEMERQGRGRQPPGARRSPRPAGRLAPCGHQQPHQVEPGGLRKCCQARQPPQIFPCFQFGRNDPAWQDAGTIESNAPSLRHGRVSAMSDNLTGSLQHGEHCNGKDEIDAGHSRQSCECSARTVMAQEHRADRRGGRLSRQARHRQPSHDRCILRTGE